MSKKTKKKYTSKDLVNTVVEGIRDKKGSNIALIDLQDIPNSITDYYVVCSATSDTQLNAIYESIEEKVEKDQGQTPWKKEGQTNKEWILLDYANVVVHLFKRDIRSFYDLENLWGDAKLTYLEDEDEENYD